MPGDTILDPVKSQNIKLSLGAQASLKAVGYEFTTFDEVIGALADTIALKQAVADLRTQISNLSAASIPSGAQTFGLGGGSVEAVKLQDKKVSWSFEGGNFSYNFDDLKASLPADMTFVSANAKVVATDGTQTATAGTKAVLPMPSQPQTAHLQANIQTKSGKITLTTEVLIAGDTGSGVTRLKTNDFTTAKADLTSAEHFELLSSELVLLKQQLL